MSENQQEALASIFAKLDEAGERRQTKQAAWQRRQKGLQAVIDEFGPLLEETFGRLPDKWTKDSK